MIRRQYAGMLRARGDLEKAGAIEEMDFRALRLQSSDESLQTGYGSPKSPKRLGSRSSSAKSTPRGVRGNRYKAGSTVEIRSDRTGQWVEGQVLKIHAGRAKVSINGTERWFNLKNKNMKIKSGT